MAKKQENDALAVAPMDLNALPAHIEAEGYDGLDDFGAEDIRIPIKTWNNKSLDANNRQRPADVFVDSITEEVTESIDAVLLAAKKTFRWTEYDPVQDTAVTMCASDDMVQGVMGGTGVVRPCAGCPDREWSTTPDGKRTRRCGPVFTVVAVDERDGSPFIVRFRRTALEPFRKYIQSHFKLRAKSKSGQRVDVPLFARTTRLSLRMHEGGKYALPVLKAGDWLSADRFATMRDQAASLRAIIEQSPAVPDNAAAASEYAE